MNKILLVEDDKTIARSLQYALEQEEFAVLVCHGVASGKQALSNMQFDLILLDVGLPDGDGYDLCRHIRGYSETPIIFLTAADEEVNVVRGLDMGADDYITKPFRVRELFSRINTVLRRTSKVEDHPKRLIAGPLVIMTDEAKVFKNHEPVAVTALEYRLLCILVQSKGNVLTRTQLLEEIWDLAGAGLEVVEDNALTVCIRRLRMKIEEDPANPQIIRTERGLGYKVGV